MTPNKKPAMSGDEKPRFYIARYGTPYLQFEYEFTIEDTHLGDASITIRTGYSEKEDVEDYANEILKILNNGTI